MSVLNISKKSLAYASADMLAAVSSPDHIVTRIAGLWVIIPLHCISTGYGLDRAYASSDGTLHPEGADLNRVQNGKHKQAPVMTRRERQNHPDYAAKDGKPKSKGAVNFNCHLTRIESNGATRTVNPQRC